MSPRTTRAETNHAFYGREYGRVMSFDLLPSYGPWCICAAAVFLGTILQRLSGAGFGMIATPVMTLVATEWVPGTILLLGLIVGVGAVWSAWDAVVVKDLPPGFTGRVIGAGVAAFIATMVVGSPLLPVIVAGVVLFSVALTLAGLTVPITRTSLMAAGTLGGFMATLTGIGAPPMAILYSSVETRRSAATQNAFFGFGMVISISALAIVGLITSRELAFAASLAPFIPMGMFFSRPLAKRFERGSIRPWALGLATVSALLLIVRSL